VSEVSKDIAGKRAVSCRDVGLDKSCSDCPFVAIGNSDDEVMSLMVKHLQETHNTTIAPGSHLDNVVRRFIRLLCAL